MSANDSAWIDRTTSPIFPLATLEDVRAALEDTRAKLANQPSPQPGRDRGRWEETRARYQAWERRLMAQLESMEASEDQD